MADEPTYQSEMSQPSHRPGMESVVNRGSDDPRDSSGNREGGRRSVAPPKRSAFGADSASDPAPAAPSKPPATTADSSIAGSGGREREAHIMSEVDKAVGG